MASVTEIAQGVYLINVVLPGKRVTNSLFLIDDEEPIRNLVCNIFGPLGYEVIEAEDGKAGLELYREHAYRLVITDIGLPVMDGYEMIEAIRTEDTDTPVIVLAGADDETLGKALERGANAIVHKPFRVQELVSTVVELIANG